MAAYQLLHNPMKSKLYRFCCLVD